MKIEMMLTAFLARGLYCLVITDVNDECEQRTASGKCCVFPFKFDGEEHQFCVTGGPSEDFWCSTTDDYGRDGQWDTCVGIDCYVCRGGDSWSDCESRQEVTSCPYMYDQCLRLSKEEANSSKLFLKECTANRLCEADNPTCRGLDVMMCDFSCCMGDFCNGATAFKTTNKENPSILLIQGLVCIMTLLRDWI